MAQEPPRWSLTATITVLAAAAAGAVFVSDWFVSALQPATSSLHMSETFAGLVVVAIAGNAVENVVGVQLALRNRPDFAIAVIVNSSLQVALALTPVILFASLFFAANLTLVFPTLLAISLLLAAFVTAVVVYDGESTWPEGVVLVGLLQHAEHLHELKVDEGREVRFAGLRREQLRSYGRPDLAAQCEEDLDHGRVELRADGLPQPTAGLLDRQALPVRPVGRHRM